MELNGKSNILFRFLLFSFTLLSLNFNGIAQNLVPNPGFEDPVSCPIFYGSINLAPPWLSATNATPDYFHVCGAIGYSVPDNFAGYQNAHSGEAYAGEVFEYTGPDTYREYIITPLTQPLIGGVPYQVSFWISLSDVFHYGSSEFGAYFSVDPPPVPSGTYEGVLDVIPQFNPDIGFVSDTQNWVLLTGCIIPQGGEQYMTIGNFSPIMNNLAISYYYIDDVSVIQGGSIQNIDIELGDPLLVCNDYLIDPNPGIPNLSYFWSDGSNDSTLLVTSTGMYALTVISGCALGKDSVEITVHGQSPVDIGPDEINICEGDTYAISLDPSSNEYLWQDGSTDPDYLITTPGLYSVTMDDGCDITSDEIQVNVIDKPAPFTLGDDTYLCPNSQIEFDFDPDEGNYLWQDSSMSAYYSIYEPGYYALTITNMCGMATDDISVISLSPPEVSLGPDSLYLCSGQVYDIDLDPALGDFHWQDGSYSHLYSIDSTGTYAVTVTNACGIAHDTIHVFYNTVGNLNLGMDAVLCHGQTITLDPNTFGNYVWQDGSTASTLLVSQGGQYSLTVTNLCGTVSDTINIQYMDSLTAPDLGPDFSLCPGEHHTFHAGVTGVNYNWQDLSHADSLLIDSPGTYYLQIANMCSDASDTVSVSANSNPPVLNLPASMNLCSGDTISIDAGISGVQYLWSDGSQASTLSIQTPGNYGLTVSNACGTSADTVDIIDAGSAPMVSLGQDISLCAGDVSLITPVSNGVVSWLWQDGSVSPTYNISGPGTISVQTTNNCGVSYDTLVASGLPPIPVLQLGNDTSLCPGETLTLSINFQDVNIVWSDGSVNTDLNVTNPGLIYATITNSCGSSSDSIDINYLPPAPTLDLGADQSLCPGNVITISPGISGVNYVWQDGSTDSLFNATQQGTIVLTVSNSCGFASDTMQITENLNGPQVDLGPDINQCAGGVVTLHAGISGVNYVWQDGSTSPDYTTDVSGTFILQVSNSCGADADTVEVMISGNAPSPDLGSDTLLCDGTSIVLKASVDPSTNILWQDGSTTPTYTVTVAGKYFLTASNSCGNAADTILVEYKSGPDDFNLGPDTTLCSGQSIVLNAPQTNSTITWQDGSHSISIIADKSLLYSLQLTNDCGSKSDSLLVNIDDRIPSISIDSFLPWCDGDVITLDAVQPFNADYLWSTGSSSPSIRVDTPGIYSVRVSNYCQSVQEDIHVILNDDCSHEVYIPTIFSPNGDQVNDFFTVSYGSNLNVVSVHCSIFDRWGNMVFNTQSLNVSWNGTYHDVSLDPGVYVYSIEFTYLIGGKILSELRRGDITLIR